MVNLAGSTLLSMSVSAARSTKSCPGCSQAIGCLIPANKTWPLSCWWQSPEEPQILKKIKSIIYLIYFFFFKKSKSPKSPFVMENIWPPKYTQISFWWSKAEQNIKEIQKGQKCYSFTERRKGHGLLERKCGKITDTAHLCRSVCRCIFYIYIYTHAYTRTKIQKQKQHTETLLFCYASFFFSPVLFQLQPLTVPSRWSKMF